MKDIQFQINNDVKQQKSRLTNELNLLTENNEAGRQLYTLVVQLYETIESTENTIPEMQAFEGICRILP